MRILFLTSRYPFPPIGGDKLRAFHFIGHMMRLGHEVHLLSLTGNGSPGACTRGKVVPVPRWKSWLGSLRGLLFSRKKPLQVWYFRSGEFGREVLKALTGNRCDLIFCHLIRTAQYVMDLPLDIPKIIDLTDAISLNYERVSQGLRNGVSFKKLLYTLEKNRVLRYEGNVLEKFDRSVLISREDRDYLGRFHDVSKASVIGNGVDTDFFPFHNGRYDAKTVVFAGNMRTLPNSDAALYFAEKVFPLVKKSVPDARFIIAGAGPSKKIKRLQEKDGNIHVTGKVEDIRPFLRAAAVSAAPMRYGAGVQNKILESMALGTPVAASSIGLEGLEAEPDKEILVGDTPWALAERVVALMRDRGLRKKLSLASRGLIEARYSWDRAFEGLDTLLEEMSGKKRLQP
ncbi:MAG: glycosyltransferase [Nitrospiraceae bacterium]|nr:glycosyltransferase [Nitrospiraceae bacterium]